MNLVRSCAIKNLEVAEAGDSQVAKASMYLSSVTEDCEERQQKPATHPKCGEIERTHVR
jgi:hypothetical protein